MPKHVGEVIGFQGKGENEDARRDFKIDPAMG